VPEPLQAGVFNYILAMVLDDPNAQSIFIVGERVKARCRTRPVATAPASGRFFEFTGWGVIKSLCKKVRFAPLEQYGNACVAMANLDNDPNLTGQRWAPSGSEFIHLKMSADNPIC
jgi:hypothetical protein